MPQATQLGRGKAEGLFPELDTKAPRTQVLGEGGQSANQRVPARWRRPSRPIRELLPSLPIRGGRREPRKGSGLDGGGHAVMRLQLSIPFLSCLSFPPNERCTPRACTLAGRKQARKSARMAAWRRRCRLKEGGDSSGPAPWVPPPPGIAQPRALPRAPLPVSPAPGYGCPRDPGPDRRPGPGQERAEDRDRG